MAVHYYLNSEDEGLCADDYANDWWRLMADAVYAFSSGLLKEEENKIGKNTGKLNMFTEVRREILYVCILRKYCFYRSIKKVSRKYYEEVL